MFLKEIKYIVFVISILTLTFFSCTNSRSKIDSNIPDDLIPVDRMTSILSDMHLVESTLVYSQYKLNDIEYTANYYYEQIFEKHDISRERFNKSMKYYSYHLDKMEKMYEDIIVDYTKMEEEKKEEKGEE